MFQKLLTPVTSEYYWCSGAWFERTASLSAIKTNCSFKIDKLQIEDDF
jgi:putative transposase